jgi:AcrR family transcriptional regulator
MGHRHSKDEILRGALEAALADGLSNLTFGRVARHLGISDRMVVYYFPSKDDLVTEVVTAMAVELQETLSGAIGAAAADYLEVARAAWPLLARPAADRVFALFLEANGLAAAGKAPYDALVPGIIDAWIGWLMPAFSGSARQRRVEAEAVIATIDGLLLLRQLAGPAAANRAAARLGVAGDRTG